MITLKIENIGILFNVLFQRKLRKLNIIAREMKLDIDMLLVVVNI